MTISLILFFILFKKKRYYIKKLALDNSFSLDLLYVISVEIDNTKIKDKKKVWYDTRD